MMPTHQQPDLYGIFARLVGEARDTDQIEELAWKSPAVHFACYCRIRDKNNREIQPDPNILQLRMSEAYETLRDMGVKIRIIGVKPRRAGCSTFAAHILYHHGQKFPSIGIAISDKKEHSATLLEKLKAYPDTDDFPWGTNVVSDPAHSIKFSNGTRWNIDTAENSDASVGDTNQLGLFSEVSKWPQTTIKNDKKVMGAVLPTLSGSDTVVIAESTPENAAGWHYKTWGEAVWLHEFIAMWEKGIRPEEQWIKVFSAWFEFHDNQRAEPVQEAEREEIDATKTEREKAGIEKYGWTYEQIAWRRDTIRSVCNGDERMFDFYFPEDDVTCWIAGGNPRFDQQALAEMEASISGTQVDNGYLVTQETGKTVFLPTRDGKGDILIWEQPQVGLRYLVTCDPASDESQTVGADPDRHSVSVWRTAYTMTNPDGSSTHRVAKKVARLRPPFYGDGDVVAGHVTRLSKYYGNAIVSLEINAGLDILRQLQDAGVPLYKRRPLSHRTGKIVEQYGFRMGDKQERNAIIEGFAAAIRERAIEVHCRHSIEEYKAFIVPASGKAQAAPGAHDDDCFVAGTRILTPTGEIPIERLKIGDMVITRNGPRKILRTFSKVKNVVFNNGLVGTPDHPVITENGEKPLESLSASDTLYMWNETTKSTEKRSYTTGKGTTDTQIQNADTSVFIFGDMTNGKSHLSRFIGRFGLITMGIFQKVILSITSTAIRSTMRLEILKSWLLENTPNDACSIQSKRESCGRQERDRLDALLLLLQNGVPTQNASMCAVKHPENHFSSLSGNLFASAARLVSFLQIVLTNTAQKAAEFGSAIVKRLQKRRVYNIHVEDTHEYFANRILVHNCMADCIAWETLPSATEYRKHVAKAPQPPDRHSWRRVNVVKRGW